MTRQGDFTRIGDKLGISPFRMYLADDLVSRFMEACGRTGGGREVGDRLEDGRSCGGRENGNRLGGEAVGIQSGSGEGGTRFGGDEGDFFGADDADGADAAELIRWLLLHAAVQAGGGHLRTDLSAVAEEMREWYTAEAASVPGFNPDLPEVIGGAVEALTNAALESGLWGVLDGEDAAADSFDVPRPPMVLSHDKRYLYFLRRRRLEDELLECLERRLGSADGLSAGGGAAGHDAGAAPSSAAGDSAGDSPTGCSAADGSGAGGGPGAESGSVADCGGAVGRAIGGSVFPLPADLPENAAGRLAKLLAEGRRLILLSGGPGTGKTTTVAALLGLLEKGRAEALEAVTGAGAEAVNPSAAGAAAADCEVGADSAAPVPLKAALAAPTGRAAARMTDGLAAAGSVRSEYTARTLHSLLEMRPGRPPLRNKERPLDAALVIVDEASMVDAAMMLSLLKAMPETAPLLLVGDPDQLPSVEAGALLGDLLSAKDGRLAAVTERLTKVYRSSTAVLEAADAVRSGDSEALAAACRETDEKSGDGDDERDGVRIHTLESPAGMAEIISDIYRDLVEKAENNRTDTAELFSLMEHHTVLSPLRRGVWGVAAMNNRVSAALGGTISPFAGMPVVVTGNDPRRGLWNGDRGVIVREEGRLRARFPESGGFRTFPLAALPGWEPAWMQTIHKSQGSEFNRVTIVLPEGAERLLSREILYTAFTRARSRVDLYADTGVVDAALGRGVVRHSRIRRWAAGKR